MKESSNDIRCVKTAHVMQNQAVVLIPQPTEDPQDPLNWSARKKYLILFTLCFSCFAAAAGPTSFQLAYVLQAPLYHKSSAVMSYSITAAVAGLLGGPLVFGPFAHLFGRCSLILWSMFGVLIAQIWAACMTEESDYIPFVVSRLIAGMFAAVPTIITPSFIIDIFFLHQRGRCFVLLEISLLSAVIISPTLGGFIVQTQGWPVTLWWTIGPIGLGIIFVAMFLEETGFARGTNATIYPPKPTSFAKSRIAIFLPGTKVVPSITIATLLKAAIAPFEIGISPITLLAGMYCFVAFGFTILINLVNTIILQTPVELGGYGFSPLQNALFSFAAWAGVIGAQLIGHLLGDRVPLWVSTRNGGIWHPEYRLWNMPIPALLGPAGLGIFGAALQYHLHYMVLALGFFFVTLSSSLAVPVCINYIVECFLNSANEVAIIMNCYRLAFAVGLGFFVFPWEASVGRGWTFGMAAFFDILAALWIVLLIWKGKALRKYTPKRLLETEEGEPIMVVE